MKLFGSRKTANDAAVQFASSGETTKRAREVQILVNLIEPDPKYQPIFISDEAGPLDICNLDEPDYFPETVIVDMRAPLWRLVDALKVQFPWWPDEGPREK